jgi:hypothetical protein
MSNNVPQPPPARLRNRLEPLAMIAVFDIAGPPGISGTCTLKLNRKFLYR